MQVYYLYYTIYLSSSSFKKAAVDSAAKPSSRSVLSSLSLFPPVLGCGGSGGAAARLMTMDPLGRDRLCRAIEGEMMESGTARSSRERACCMVLLKDTESLSEATLLTEWPS